MRWREASVAVERGDVRPLFGNAEETRCTVFTLYDGPSFPFVHALDVASGGALCYELIGLSDLPVARLRLQFGSSSGSVDVLDGSATVAQSWVPSSLYGPSVRIAGTAHAPR